MLEKMRTAPATFERAAWGVLAYNVLVILWGAVVRATGSGAGCGDHWPLCNGAIVPRAPAMETVVEFTHRLTSGVALLAVVALLLTALASFPKGHVVRKAAVASTAFVFLEALIGAGIVLFRLVADDQSLVRGVSMALHLVNTFLLLGALTLTAWWTQRPVPVWKASGGHKPPARGLLGLSVGVGFVALAAVGMTGAIAALGDTLFPTAPFTAVGSPPSAMSVVAEEARHIFLQLRVWHPVAALFAAIWWGTLSHLALLGSTPQGASRGAAPQGQASLMAPPKGVPGSLQVSALIVFLVTVLQLGLGVLNVALRAPIWLQLVHLFLANVLVVACVAFASDLLVSGWKNRSGELTRGS